MCVNNTQCCHENCNCSAVDLSKLEVGSIVHFRNGGKNKVENVSGFSSATPSFKSEGYHFVRYRDGRLQSGNKTPLDIVKVDPPEFDWANVKPGMAFINSKNYRDTANYIYIGPAVFVGHAVFVLAKGSNYPISMFKRDLARNPRKDETVLT